MNVFVAGASGLLGSNVVADLSTRGASVTAGYHEKKPNQRISQYQLDIRDRQRFRHILTEAKPDVVVNCASMTDVDACETAPQRARAVNAQAPGNMATECNRYGVDFIHVSTDYVFDGASTERYSEADRTNPIQTYGKTKLAGEQLVRNRHDAPLILRPSFLYGRHGESKALTGFPAWVRDRLKSGETVPLFDDQRVTPSRAGQVSEVLIDLLQDRSSGIYHVASRSCVTPFTFGEIVRRWLDVPEERLEKTSMNDIERSADRPRSSCLSVEKIERQRGTSQPNLCEDLDALVDHTGQN